MGDHRRIEQEGENEDQRRIEVHEKIHGGDRDWRVKDIKYLYSVCDKEVRLFNYING